MQRIDELKKQGWHYRFTAKEPRLSETVSLYQESGFEVHLEPLPKVENSDSHGEMGEFEGCRICFRGDEDKYRMVFTKPASLQDPGEEDLF